MATMNWFNGNISELKKIPVISRFDQIFSTLCILQGVFAIMETSCEMQRKNNGQKKKTKQKLCDPDHCHRVGPAELDCLRQKNRLGRVAEFRRSISDKPRPKRRKHTGKTACGKRFERFDQTKTRTENRVERTWSLHHQ